MKPIQLLNQMVLDEFIRKHPENPYPLGGKFKASSKANDVTKAVIKFLTLSGHQAERINTMGRVIDDSKVVENCLGQKYKIGSSRYIPTTSTKGSSDISATIRGRSVKIEVKVGKDRQSENQKKYQQVIERAGGVYIIVHSFDEFYEWFQTFTS